MAAGDAFWTVAGAGAPLIALANQVTVSDSLGMMQIFTWVRAGAAPDSKPFRYAAIGRRWAIAGLFIGYTNLVAQAGAFAVALVSLVPGGGTPPGAMAFAGLVEFLGLLALAATSQCSARVRQMRFRLNMGSEL